MAVSCRCAHQLGMEILKPLHAISIVRRIKPVDGFANLFLHNKRQMDLRGLGELVLTILEYTVV